MHFILRTFLVIVISIWSFSNAPTVTNNGVKFGTLIPLGESSFVTVADKLLSGGCSVPLSGILYV